MVELGGVHDMTELKCLVLYVLKMCGEPVPFETINDILLNDGLVDFFEFATVLSQLEESGHVERKMMEEEECYTYTPLGSEAISMFQSDISYVVREKVTKAAKEVLRQRKLNQQVKATYQKLPDGGYQLTLTLKEQEKELFSLTMEAPTLSQVNTICRNFKQNPAHIYHSIIQTLTEK